ncbi:hypothetical protein AK830_g2691 [Neonectria ditissima]|uniref:Uncharacterized protein n=1 Tax=Neonectria ditissima TaxID=78410 RepID=A0A0P7BQZ9_9HYPO|nr:hypothetical protein AK830_g2691 [Neonectria ditissima]
MPSWLRTLRKKLEAPAPAPAPGYTKLHNSEPLMTPWRSTNPPAQGYWETMDWLVDSTSKALDAVLNARDQAEDAVAFAKLGFFSRRLERWRRTRRGLVGDLQQTYIYGKKKNLASTPAEFSPWPFLLGAYQRMQRHPNPSSLDTWSIFREGPLASRVICDAAFFAASRVYFAPVRCSREEERLHEASLATIHLMQVPRSPLDVVWLERVLECVKVESKTPKETWNTDFPEELVTALLGQSMLRRSPPLADCLSSCALSAGNHRGHAHKAATSADSVTAILNFSMASD